MGKADGIFSITKPIEVPEVENNDFFDMVSRFDDAIAQRCRRLTCVSTNKCFLNFAEACQNKFRYGSASVWLVSDINGLRDVVQKFQCLSTDFFWKFQISDMWTCKWRSLDHPVDDLEDVGSMNVGHVDLYEFSYSLFKAMYKKLLELTGSVMHEFINTQNRATK